MITRETLKLVHMRQGAHYDGRGFFAYDYRCVEYPRLKRHDRYEKKTRSVTSSWWVDGAQRASLDEAIAALNVPPEIAPADREALQHVPDDYADIRSHEKPGWEALHWLAEKGLIDWQHGKCRRSELARELVK